MSNQMLCPLCDNELSRESDYEKDTYICNCQNCGKYTITYESFHDLQDNKKKYKYLHLASGFIREMNEMNNIPETITISNFNNLINNSYIPNTIIEKLNKLLQYLYRKSETLYSIIEINDNIPAIAYAKDTNELKNYYKTILNLKYIKFPYVSDKIKCHLTLEGIIEAEKHHTDKQNLKQCFVALWFNDEMSNIFNEVISKSIIDSGYKPFVIPMKEHNEDIFDHIILEIKRSKFVIADFTGSRGGVYYEAGYAHGLGLPVIYTCREDWFNKTEKINKKGIIDGIEKEVFIDEERIIHFDINHLNFIVWKNKDDLYNKLTKRIQATIS